MNLTSHDHEILPCYLLESGDIAEPDTEQQDELQTETLGTEEAN